MSNLAYNIRNTETTQELRIMSKLKRDEWEVHEIADKPFYTTQDVADVIGASGRSTIRMAIKQGRIIPMETEGMRDSVFSFDEVKRFAETYKIAVKKQLGY